MPLEFAEVRPPIPPADLMLRVTQGFEADQIEAARVCFDGPAQEMLRDLENALGAVGREFSSFRRLLDFGCGCGRYVRHFGPLSRTVEIHGVDIDADMIDWMRANIPFGTYVVGPHEPPLPYPDGFFDLVVNHSVFTHLDARMQDLWLAELQRITQPGGLVLLTIESLATWNSTLESLADAQEDVESYRTTLERDGILFISDDLFVGSTHPDFYHSTFHAPWYVFEHWTQFFELAAYLTSGSGEQDLVILRRRPANVPVPRPIGHRNEQRMAVSPSLKAGPTVTDSRSTPVRILCRALHTAARRTRLRVARRSVGAGTAELGQLSADVEEIRSRLAQRERTVGMLQVGLYEQGRRISILARELRNEAEVQAVPAENFAKPTV